MSKYAKRTDENQAAIVRGLRLGGRQVIVTNFGDDFPDLLVNWGDQWLLIEVKKESGSLTRGQLKFLADSRGKVAVATSPGEALCANGLTQTQQTSLLCWLAKNSQETLSVRKFRKVIG